MPAKVTSGMTGGLSANWMQFVYGALILVVVTRLVRFCCGGGRRSRQFIVPGRQQAYEAAPARPGETPVMRNLLTKQKGKLVERIHDDVYTLYDNLKHAAAGNPQGRCLGTIMPDGKTITWLSFTEVLQQAHEIGSGLVALGLRRGARVAIYSVNRAEWVLTEQACNAYAMPTVAVYDTLGEDVVEYIVVQAGVDAIVCSADKLGKVLKCCKTVKHVICMDSSEKVAEAFKAAKGKAKPVDPMPPTLDDIATIMYTSGTTDMPKGALISHGNLVADIAGARLVGCHVVSSDVYISYLPLAHIFERVMEAYMMGSGGAIVFFRGSVDTLFADIQLAQPTVFASVPRLYNRVYDKVMTGVRASKLKSLLFDIGMSVKRRNLRRGVRGVTLWDLLVFRKIRKALGGRVRYMITGSAPISSDVLEFLRVCFDADVFEGYGQTETSAGTTLTMLGDFTLGHVGPPMCCSEIKLVDVPEMNYLATSNPPCGELCSRGPHIFKGYHNNEEKTREAIDDDGWLHSGDIARLNPNGTFTIIDRKKNIFKLAQGEYIAPEKIEGVYQTCQYVAQVWVYGHSLQSVLVAVVVPDVDVLKQWARGVGRPDADEVDKLCRDPKVVQLVLDDMTRVGKEKKLRGFEFVRAIHLETRPFDVARDLLTPSFKLKRPQLRTYYAEILNDLYAKASGGSS